jgi:putative aldouronate transport system substrate-binding protein
LKHFTDIPQLQEMVAFFNKIYREGLLDQEALVIKDAQLKEKFAQDRVGVHFLNSYEISTIVDDLKQGEAKDISYILMPWIFDEGIDGTYNGNRKLGPEAPSGLYISKALSEYQVDELFKALDWMLTLDGQLLVNYGIEGEHWNYDADGKIQKTQAFIDRADHDWNKEAHEGVGYYQQIAYNELVFEELIPESIRFPRPESKITHEHQKSIWSDKPSEDLDPILYTSPGAVEQELLASIGIAWNDMVIKAILAKSEADARNIVTGWPDTLNKMGWDKIVKERGDSAKSLDMNW